MKKFILALILAVTALPALADDVLGIWKTEVDDGKYAYVTFAPCEGKICGTISRTFNAEGEYQATTIGRKLVWDMVPDGKGNYHSGQIWQPSTDKIYKSKMALDGNTLKVSGCVGPICKKQVWSRVQ